MPLRPPPLVPSGYQLDRVQHPVAKMAALCAGSYGLSQQGSLNDENKELIFVKLTDSALRAIEEFQRTQVSSKMPVVNR